MEVKEITKEAKIPDKKSVILIPGTTSVAKYNIVAFITKVNNPKVKILIGKVSRIKIGLITIFKSPTTTAAKRAVVKPSILNPGTIKEATIKDKAEKSQVKSNPM